MLTQLSDIFCYRVPIEEPSNADQPTLSYWRYFFQTNFTVKEVSASRLSPNQAEYLSTRFAAKEAFFKAVAHFTKEKGFDFWIVETLNECDGYPIVQVNEKLQTLLDEAGIETLHVSMTTEGDFATAIVVASSGSWEIRGQS